MIYQTALTLRNWHRIMAPMIWIMAPMIWMSWIHCRFVQTYPYSFTLVKVFLGIYWFFCMCGDYTSTTLGGFFAAQTLSQKREILVTFARVSLLDFLWSVAKWPSAWGTKTRLNLESQCQLSKTCCQSHKTSFCTCRANSELRRVYRSRPWGRIGNCRVRQ